MLEALYPIDYSARRSEQTLADKTFVERWSPRSFEKVSLEQETLDTIFDAARFSPSAYNSQPWRIFSSKSDKSDFDRFLGLLVEMNQKWAQNASALGFMIARKNFDHNGQENRWALYDCGFAWASMTFQANQLGLYTHGMAGIKVQEVYAEFGISEDEYQVIAGFAIGKLAAKEQLPENFQKKEFPSARKPLNEIYFPSGAKL